MSDEPTTAPLPASRPSTPLWRRGSVWVMAAAVAFVALVVSSAVAISGPTPTIPSAGVHLGGKPVAVAVGENAVWVTGPDKHLLVRIDPKSKHVVKKIPIPGLIPRAVAVAGTVVWVADPGVAVARIDAQKNRVVKVIKLPGGKAQKGVAVPACSLAADRGAVWVANPDGSVTRIDPAKNRVLGSIQIGGAPGGIAAAGGSVWVTTTDGDSIVR